MWVEEGRDAGVVVEEGRVEEVTESSSWGLHSARASASERRAQRPVERKTDSAPQLRVNSLPDRHISKCGEQGDRDVRPSEVHVAESTERRRLFSQDFKGIKSFMKILQLQSHFLSIILFTSSRQG